ncbi:hypothetical protein MMC19_002912 [Ptychographa xylographoides]|nr:hypothetical protein [Ptychographa xylographoides]
MGGPPAVVIIARHGARLDAADKQWHLTSPTPYDPPLTYGGWIQSRALGARIATLLRAREESQHSDATSGAENTIDTSAIHEQSKGHHQNRPNHQRRRKHKVVIHSSPFVRCVQTSIAIAAGLNQQHTEHDNSRRRHAASKSHLGPSRRKNSEHSHSPNLFAIQEPAEDSASSSTESKHKSRITTKVRLRLDAFLGEWLSPDYYDAITPPPGSVMMVASAKADLLRNAEAISTSEDLSGSTPSRGHFPGGWDNSTWSGLGEGTAAVTDGQFPTLLSLAQALPKRDRASSHSSAEISKGKIDRRSLQKTNQTRGTSHGYAPPIPTYAISPSDAIPSGYVAHAREACVEVDYQWDSMRPPLDWGTGGEYGEEWSSMHHRFRRGLQRMIQWYRIHCEPGEIDKNVSTRHHDDEDDETDTVLVLVTHGAGCNALIGAVTNQPVLLDVGMASLTMAIRKENSETTPDGIQPLMEQRRRSSIDYGISHDYEVRLVASTDHLRMGSSSAANLSKSQPSPKSFTPYPPTYRSRYGSMVTTTMHDSPIEGVFKLPDSVISGNIQRSASVATARSNSGLWSMPSADSVTSSPEKRGSLSVASENVIPAKVVENNIMPTLPVTTGKNRQTGLWGASASDIVSEREKGPKRRWTVSEQ